MEVGPITLIPWGLQNLLGIKGDVGILRALEAKLQPTTDLWDYLAACHCKELLTQQVNINTGGFNSFASFTVPVDQIWLVRGASFSTAFTLATETFRGKLIQTGHGNGNVRQVTDEGTSSLTDAVGIGQAVAGSRGGPFVMFPGDGMGVSVVRLTTAGTIATTVQAYILRFHV